MALNMTAIPQAIGDILGVSYEVAGIIISVGLTIALILALSLLVEHFMSILPVSIVSIAMFTLFTFLDWFPIWILIIISGLTAVLMAKEVNSMFSGGG